MPSQHEELPPEPWHSFLTELDAMVKEQTDFQCLGGFVVTRLYGRQRPTADVDVLSIYPREERTDRTQRACRGSELHKKYGVYLDYVGVVTVPWNYEDRLVQIFPVYKNLRLFALDPYDLALSKLERNIGRDREDVRYLARTIPLDLKLLQDRYQEEHRPNVMGDLAKGNCDAAMDMWVEMIKEDRKPKGE